MSSFRVFSDCGITRQRRILPRRGFRFFRVPQARSLGGLQGPPKRKFSTLQDTTRNRQSCRSAKCRPTRTAIAAPVVPTHQWSPKASVSSLVSHALHRTNRLVNPVVRSRSTERSCCPRSAAPPVLRVPRGEFRRGAQRCPKGPSPEVFGGLRRNSRTTREPGERPQPQTGPSSGRPSGRSS